MVLILSYYQVHKARLLRSDNVLIPRDITRRIATKPIQKMTPQFASAYPKSYLNEACAYLPRHETFGN